MPFFSKKADVVKLLLGKGANVEALNDNVRTPITYAIFSNSAVLAEVLKYNPDLSVKFFGKTLLNNLAPFFLQEDKQEMIWLLLLHGANPINENGRFFYDDPDLEPEHKARLKKLYEEKAPVYRKLHFIKAQTGLPLELSGYIADYAGNSNDKANLEQAGNQQRAAESDDSRGAQAAGLSFR